MNAIERIMKEIELLIKDEPFYSKIIEAEKPKDLDNQQKSNLTLSSEKQSPEEQRDVESKMKKLEREIMMCRRCSLHSSRTNAVPGEGSYKTSLMIVGEGPGREEDLQGRPFVGKAGQLLTKLLEEIGIRRKDVYITNVVKCRPPENRTPSQEEISSCKTFLEKQLEIINPKAVLLLGATASKAVIGEEKITKIRGEAIEIEETIFFPTFHPAAVLRDEANKLPIIKQDFQKLKNILRNLQTKESKT
ncbi:MAG: uracil-DNA glycosylase [Brevinematia bacterium]